MGKGHNHHPNCTCGWCSGGYRGGSKGAIGNMPFPTWTSYFGSEETPAYKTVESFTDPNALCPVCGAAVFFYRSPLGGRVFFDSLGPPWPKHPCTDSAMQSDTGTSKLVKRVESQNLGLRPPWALDRWHPLFVLEARSSATLSNCLCLHTIFARQWIKLYVRIDSWPRNSLCQVREDAKGVFTLSILRFDHDGQFWIETIIATDNESRLIEVIARYGPSGRH